jgi:hypothetical protein
MGAGYHPDGGDCYHHGAPGEFHVGQGLSQRVWDKEGKIGWAAQTKAGKRIFPYNHKSYERAKARGVNFRDYTGQFKDQSGHKVYVPKKQPTHVFTPKEYNDYLRFRHQTSGKSGRNQKAHNQKGRQGQQQNKTKKNSKNHKLNNYHFIDLLNKLKENVVKVKKEAFPSISKLGEMGLSDVATEYAALLTTFGTSAAQASGDFKGRSDSQTWPKLLLQVMDFDQIQNEKSDSAKYKSFFHIISNAKRGIAQAIHAVGRHKDAVKKESDLTQAIAKANNISGVSTLDEVNDRLIHMKQIALHSAEQIFEILPNYIVNYVEPTTTYLNLFTDLVKEKEIVDEKTKILLVNHEFKLLKEVLKRAKRIKKQESAPAESRVPGSATGSAKSKLTTEGLVGMSGDHVY